MPPDRDAFEIDVDQPDTQWAWELFGGKTLDEAYNFFCERPEIYQEAFAWMGAVAFRYYYPILDQYMRSIVKLVETDEFYAWIIAKDVQSHFEQCQNMTGIHLGVISLCEYVERNIFRFSPYEGDESEIQQAFRELKEIVSEQLRLNTNPN